MPDLLEATKEYWRKLDELEAAYHRGEVAVEEVDAEVQSLIAKLGQERRAALAYLLNSWSRLWHEQQETIISVAILGIITYAWAVVS